MTQREPENAKAIPIHYYDFRVDYKIEENEVYDNFLDPEQNKHIQVLNRPQSAKSLTFGSPQKHPSRKDLNTNAVDGHTPDLKGLVVYGTNNPGKKDPKQSKRLEDTKPIIEENNEPPPIFEEEDIDEGDQMLAPKRNLLIDRPGTAGPATGKAGGGRKNRPPPEPSSKKWVPPEFTPKDIKTWVNSSPPKSMSKNPMMALSMFKKKTKEKKSQQIIKNNLKDYENSDTNMFIGGNTSQNVGDSLNLQGGALSSIRPQSAGQMKGFSAGKKITKDQQKYLKETREQNAGKSSGVSVTFDKLKAIPKAKKLAAFGSSQKPKQETASKKRPSSAIVASAVSLMKSLATKKILAKTPDDINEEDLDDIDTYMANSGLLKLGSSKPKSTKMNAGSFKKVQDIVSMGMSKQAGLSASTNLEALGSNSKFLVSNPSQQKQKKNQLLAAAQLKTEPVKVDKEFADDQFDEDIAGENEEYGQGNDQGGDDNNLFEQEEIEGGDQAAPPTRPFKSNISSALKDALSSDLLFSNDNDLTNLSDSPVKIQKQASNVSGGSKNKFSNKQDQATDAPKDKMRELRQDHNIMFSKVKDGLDYNRMSRQVDGEKQLNNRKKVTDQVKDYLQNADERRKKKIDEYFGNYTGGRIQPYNENSDPQMQKAKNTNDQLKSSVEKMQGLISGVKNFDKTHSSWVQGKEEQLGQRHFSFVQGLEDRLARRRKQIEDNPNDDDDEYLYSKGGKYIDEFESNQINKPEISFDAGSPLKNAKSPSNVSLMNPHSNYKGSIGEWENVGGNGGNLNESDEFENID